MTFKFKITFFDVIEDFSDEDGIITEEIHTISSDSDYEALDKIEEIAEDGMISNDAHRYEIKQL